MMLDKDEDVNMGIPNSSWGWVTREFGVSIPLLSPRGGLGTTIDGRPARLALITRFRVWLLFHDTTRGNPFLSTALAPGQTIKISLPDWPTGKENRHLSPEDILDRVIMAFGQPECSGLPLPPVEDGRITFATALEGVTRALEGSFNKLAEHGISTKRGEPIREEEFTNPNVYSCLTLFFHDVVQDVTLVTSVVGFSVEIAGVGACARVRPEDAPAPVRSLVEELIATARDYRGRTFTGLSNTDYYRPYALLAGGSLDVKDEAVGLDRSVITGCVVGVSQVALHVPGYYATSTVGPDCRDERERLLDGIG